MDREVGPGTVVEYYEDKKLLCAVCTELKSNRLLVLTEQDREANIAQKRILHLDDRRLDPGQSRAYLVTNLQEMAGRRRDLTNRIAAEELWDLLKEEQEGFDCRQLAGFCFSEEITADHTSAVLRALLSDSLHFKYRGELFYANTPERVEQIRLQQEREIQKERELAEASAWLAAVWRRESVPEPEGRDHYVQMLKDFCLAGVEAASYQQTKKILGLAEVPVPHGAFELLVRLGAWKRDENLYLHRYGIQETFPEEVMNATVRSYERLSGVGVGEGREDLTALPLMTIDGPMTRDYDDALSVRFLAGGAEVGIHIADAAEYIPIDSPLDQEALARATSLYLPDAKIPMLPAILSEGFCSLKQGEDRLALSILVRFDEDDRVESRRFTLSRVRVRHQLTYGGTDEMVATDETLRYLYRLCIRLRRQRIASGALHLPLPEPRIWVNGNGVVHISRADRETPSQVVVSELMILANALAAEEMAARGITAIYRCQEKPQEIVVREPTDDLYLNYRQRRYLSRAELATTPKRHNGLGMSAYTSWTSPIRRYVDLVVQRQLKSMASGAPPPYERARLEEIIPRLVLPQSRAMLIKRQWTRYWILRHLEREKIRTLEALVLDQGRRTFHLLLPEYMLEASMALEEGRGLNPGDHFRVEIVCANAREEILKLKMA